MTVVVPIALDSISTVSIEALVTLSTATSQVIEIIFPAWAASIAWDRPNTLPSKAAAMGSPRTATRTGFVKRAPEIRMTDQSPEVRIRIRGSRW